MHNELTSMIINRVKNIAGYPESSAEILLRPTLLDNLDLYGDGDVRPMEVGIHDCVVVVVLFIFVLEWRYVFMSVLLLSMLLSWFRTRMDSCPVVVSRSGMGHGNKGSLSHPFSANPPFLD